MQHCSFLKPELVSNSNSPKPTAYEVLGMVPNQESVITSAEFNQGAGTWITRWGDLTDLSEKKEIIEGKRDNDYIHFRNSIVCSWINP